MRSTVICLTILMVIASTKALSTEMDLHLCSNNQPIGVQIMTNENGADIACQCLVGPTRDLGVREGYVYTPGVGSHKLHYAARPWNEARRVCIEEKGHLAIINSKTEESVLVNMLQSQQKTIIGTDVTNEAHIGIHDLFRNGEWVDVFWKSIYSGGYSNWAYTSLGQQPDNFGGNQICGAIVNTGGLDDVDCNQRLAFICELPLTC